MRRQEDLEAWEELAEAGMPQRAHEVFSDTTVVSYQNAMGNISRQLSEGSKFETAKKAVQLGKFFRKNYKRAGDLAKEVSK